MLLNIINYLNSPNIIKFHFMIDDDKFIYAFYDYLDGGNL